MSNPGSDSFRYSGDRADLVSACRQAFHQLSLKVIRDSASNRSFTLEASEKIRWLMTKWPSRFHVQAQRSGGIWYLVVRVRTFMFSTTENREKVKELSSLIQSLLPSDSPDDYRALGQKQIVDAAGNEVSPLELDEHLHVALQGRLERVLHTYTWSGRDSTALIFNFTRLEVGFSGEYGPVSWVFAKDQLVGVNKDGSLELLQKPPHFLLHPPEWHPPEAEPEKLWQGPRSRDDEELGAVWVRYYQASDYPLPLHREDPALPYFHVTTRSDIFSAAQKAFRTGHQVSLQLRTDFKGLCPRMPGSLPGEWYLPHGIYHEGILNEATVSLQQRMSAADAGRASTRTGDAAGAQHTFRTKEA